MKKSLALIIVLLLCTATLFSCNTEDEYVETECVHEYKDATCQAPKTCSKCGETEGDVAAHTIENGACPTCGTSMFDVMKLWDEKPGQYSNSEPTYTYYNGTDYYTMRSAEDAFCFWGGKSIELGEQIKMFGSSETIAEYSIAGQIVIPREGIENKTYRWNLLIQKYDASSNSYKRVRITGKINAADFSEDTLLHMDSFTDPSQIGVTEEQAEMYVSEYATELVWGCVNGTLTEFLAENGETPVILGFANYKK